METTSSTSTRTGPDVREVTDLYGRCYRTGESAEEISGHSRRSLMWAAWACMVAISPMQYTFGVAVTGLVAANGWTLMQTLWLLAVFVLCQAGVAIPVAWLHRSAVVTVPQLVVGGGLLSAVGLLSLAHLDSLTGTLVGYSLIGGAGAGAVYTTCLTTIARWFPDKRAAMSGFVTGGFACGAVPTIALITWLGDGGPRIVFTVAALVTVIVVPVAGRILTDPPRHWWPAHIDARVWAVDRQVNPSLPNNIPAARHYSPSEALRTGLPWIWLVLALISAVSLLGIALVAGFAIAAGFSAGVAGVAAGSLAAVNGVARATAGSLSDRFGRRRVLTAVLAVEGCAFLGLAWAGSAGSGWALVVAAMFAGLGGGAFYAIFGNVVLEYFGDRNLLQNQAVVYSAKAVGGLVGIGVGALCVSRFGYAGVFLAAGLLGLVTATMVRFLKQPGRPALPVRPQLGTPAVPDHAANRTAPAEVSRRGENR